MQVDLKTDSNKCMHPTQNTLQQSCFNFHGMALYSAFALDLTEFNGEMPNLSSYHIKFSRLYILYISIYVNFRTFKNVITPTNTS